MKKELKEIVDNYDSEKCQRGAFDWAKPGKALVGISSNGPVYSEVKEHVVGNKSWFKSIGFGTALAEVEKINKMTKKEMRNALLDVMNLSGTSAMVDDPKKLRGIIAQITKTIMGDDYNKWVDFLKSELGSWDEGEPVEGWEENDD